MYKDEHFSFELMISVHGFSVKPTQYDYNKIAFKERTINLVELEQYIREGNIFSCSYIDKEIKSLKGYKKKEKALHTNIVVFDIDNTSLTFNELLKTLRYQPTLAYTTFSHLKNKGNRYRLLYVFDKPVNQNQYKVLYDNIVTNIELDNHNRTIYQFYLGSYSNCELINNYIIYNYKDISISNSINTIPPNNNIHLEMEKGMAIEEDQEYIFDYWNSSYAHLIEKYREKYLFFENNLENVDEDTPYILIPKDFCRIKRYWIKDRVELDTGKCVYFSKVRKIKDGNGRRKKLFLNAILRKYMYPNILFVHLLHCLVSELYYYIDNHKDTISKQELFNIAKNAYGEDVSKYATMIKQQQINKTTWIVNKRYCNKYNLSAKTVRNMVKKMIDDNLIGEHYDCSKSINSNISMLRELGIKVGKSKLYAWCKENGISTKGDLESDSIALLAG